MNDRERREKYRKTAERLHGNKDIQVPIRGNVAMVGGKTEEGAFVELVIWVPREEMEKDDASAQSS